VTGTQTLVGAFDSGSDYKVFAVLLAEVQLVFCTDYLAIDLFQIRRKIHKLNLLKGSFEL
jgi:hypothetical protein